MVYTAKIEGIHTYAIFNRGYWTQNREDIGLAVRSGVGSIFREPPGRIGRVGISAFIALKTIGLWIDEI
jgi:hypothetical protein